MLACWHFPLMPQMGLSLSQWCFLFITHNYDPTVLMAIPGFWDSWCPSSAPHGFISIISTRFCSGKRAGFGAGFGVLCCGLGFCTWERQLFVFHICLLWPAGPRWENSQVDFTVVTMCHWNDRKKSSKSLMFVLFISTTIASGFKHLPAPQNQ